jgi:hypothetical protein
VQVIVKKLGKQADMIRKGMKAVEKMIDKN